MNIQKIAAKKYTGAYKLYGFVVCQHPLDVCYDGKGNIYVTGPGQLRRIRTDNNAVSGALAVGLSPLTMAIDGRHLWVVDYTAAITHIIDMENFIRVGSVVSPQGCEGIGFDGTYMWLAHNMGNTLRRFHAQNWNQIDTVIVGTNPCGIAITKNGENVWTCNQANGTVSKIRAVDGVVLGTYIVGGNPVNLCYDADNGIWVSVNITNKVVKVREDDGFILGTFDVGLSPRGITSDGEDIWVACSGSNTVMRLKSDGTVLGTYQAGVGPRGICSDGLTVWVANSADTTVYKY